MTTTRTQPPSRAIRILHASQILGVVLFALVAHFVLRKSMAAAELPMMSLRALLGVALAAFVFALLVLRRRIPQRSTQDSADVYWTTATAPAVLTWAVLEGGSLLAVFLYARTGSPLAIGVGALGIVLIALLNPASLERR